MYRPRVIPTLLLKGLGLVKTTKFGNPNYIGDPMNAVKIFNDLTADELIFLDTNATPEERTISLDLLQRIGDECRMPFSVGGGIRSVDQVRNILSVGAEKVCINTAALTNPAFVSEVSDSFGNQSIIVSIDFKRKFFGRYEVFSHCGSKATGKDPLSWAIEAQELGAGEILLNSIDRDGTMMGYDLDILGKVAKAVDIPVIALGGAGNIVHFREAIDAECSAVAAGSFFVYHGKRRGVLINFPDKVELKPLFHQS